MAHDPNERGLKRFARSILVAGGDDQQVAEEPGDIRVVKGAIRRFFARHQRTGQRRDGRRGLR